MAKYYISALTTFYLFIPAEIHVIVDCYFEQANTACLLGVAVWCYVPSLIIQIIEVHVHLAEHQKLKQP